MTRSTSTVVMAALLLTACVTNQNSPVDTSCGDLAVLAEAFPTGNPHPSGSSMLVAPLEALVEGLQRDEEATIREAATTMLAIEGEPTEGLDPPRGGEEWFDAYDGLDAWGIADCGFSLHTLVMEGFDESDVVEAAVEPDASPTGIDGVLDWADVLTQVREAFPESTWAERGYVATVGVDPGVHIAISGVRSQAEADVVCSDVAAVLADEVGSETLFVRIETAGGLTLIRTRDGDACAHP